MEDLRKIIAENIVALRKSNSMTQIELAQRLDYSDKSVSKWERGESIPGVVVLKQIADIFGVTVDYLITDTHVDNNAPSLEVKPADEPAETPTEVPVKKTVVPNTVTKAQNKERTKKSGAIKLLFARVGRK